MNCEHYNENYIFDKTNGRISRCIICGQEYYWSNKEKRHTIEELLDIILLLEQKVDYLSMLVNDIKEKGLLYNNTYYHV